MTLAATNQDPWRLAGPQGIETVRTQAPLKTNSNEVVRECLLEGVGIALRSTWDIGPELQSGALRIVLPEYRGSANLAIHAVYPSREFMPSKVNVFIEFLTNLYGTDPYWNDGIDLERLRTPSSMSAA